MSHRNAQLTMHGRRLLDHPVRVERIACRSCRQGGTSRQCAHRWGTARTVLRKAARHAEKDELLQVWIDASITSGFVTWELAVHCTVGGRKYVVRVNYGGRPFRTFGPIDSWQRMFEWRWWDPDGPSFGILSDGPL